MRLIYHCGSHFGLRGRPAREDERPALAHLRIGPVIVEAILASATGPAQRDECLAYMRICYPCGTLIRLPVVEIVWPSLGGGHGGNSQGYCKGERSLYRYLSSLLRETEMGKSRTVNIGGVSSPFQTLGLLWLCLISPDIADSS